MKFKEYYLSEFFSFGRNKGIKERDRIQGEIPYVGAKNNNNGVVGYVIGENRSIHNQIIGLNNDGQGGIGLAFYHPYEVLLSNHVTTLIPLKKYSENEFLYFLPLIEIQTKKFSRAYAINNDRLNKIKIKMPTKENEAIDWEFINNYVEHIKNKVNAKTEAKEIKVASLHKGNDYKYKITELFTYSRGNLKNLKRQNMGCIPVVSASEKNNGITQKIQFVQDATIYNETLTISNNGSVGNVFYHPYDHYATTDITILKPLYNFNEKHMIYLSVILEKQLKKFSYSYKISNERLESLTLLLPHENIKAFIEDDLFSLK